MVDQTANFDPPQRGLLAPRIADFALPMWREDTGGETAGVTGR
jgi:hypothetical protein